jgi:hypothetical protein
MKLIALLLGATFLFSPTGEATEKHHRCHHRDHDGYREVVRYSRPPLHVRRHWHHGRVYTWGGRRYHWNDGAWVIYAPLGPRLVVYR